MSTATEVAPVDLTALDFHPTCQSQFWYLFLDKQATPDCGAPAEYTAEVHDFRTCTGVEKFLCGACLKRYAGPCPSCNGPRLGTPRPIGRPA